MSLEFAPGASFGQGRYEIHRELGRGGMGRVLLAYAQHLERYVVVKVLQAGQDERTLVRFQREAQALAQARHRYVVPVHEFGVEEGCPFIVMGFVEGETLEAYVSRLFREGKRLETEWVREFFLKLVEALQSLHEHGIVHRDVKPANILISADSGDPVLVDFGLAKIDQTQFRATLESLTQSGQFLGTPGFMPPEQLDTRSGFGEVGTASDVWGFGATLFYAISGQQPFQGRTLIELAAALMSLDAPRLRSVDGETPQWLDELCHQCLRRSVIERPTTEAIFECLDSSGSQGLGSKGSQWKILFVLLLLFVFAVLGVLWKLQQLDPAPVLEFKESQSSLVTNKEVFEVTGRVVAAEPSHVLVNGKRVECNRAGVFRKSVPLKEGRQVIQVMGVDASGQATATRDLTVNVDRRPPEITLDPVISTQNGEVLIEGTANEAILTAKYLSGSCELDGRRFSIKLKLEDYSRDGALTVRDMAGNETTTRLPFGIAGQTKERSFGTFSSALKRVKPGDTLFLVAGRYKMISKPRVSIKIVGLGQRAEVVLYAKNRPFLDLRKESMAFKNLTVKHESREGGGIVAKSGRIEFDDCVLGLEGVKSFIVDSEEAAVTVVATNCQFNLAGREGSRFSKAKVTFKNLDIRDCRQLLVQGENLELISMMECDRFYWFRVKLHGSRAGGVLVVQSRGEMENCEINHCNKIGLVLNGGRLKLRGSFIHSNRYAGLALGHGAKAEALACRFRGNGSSVDQRFAGIHVYDRSELTLLSSEVIDHSQYGIVAVDDSRVKLIACTLKNNKPSDCFDDYQGVIERRD